MKTLKTSHEFARELLALPDLTIMHLDPSFADACDEETDRTLGIPTAEVVDPFVGLDEETIEEFKDSGVGKFITISGDQPEEYDRKPGIAGDRIELVRLLKGAAYQAWRASLCAGPRSITDLFSELKNPKVGDLVMEISTLFMKGNDPVEGIGRLVSITQEPVYTPEAWKASGASEGEAVPTEPVYTIALIFDDGREFRWRNAMFIKVKTDS